MNFPNVLIWLVSLAFQIYTWLIVARVILSYVRLRTHHPVLRFIYEVTEPLLDFFRRLLPQTGAFDFSPLLAVFFLQIASSLVSQLLYFLFTVGR